VRTSQKTPRLYYKDQWVNAIQEIRRLLFESHTKCIRITLCARDIEFLLMAYGAYSSHWALCMPSRIAI
jgi:hypothetical protein